MPYLNNASVCFLSQKILLPISCLVLWSIFLNKSTSTKVGEMLQMMVQYCMWKIRARWRENRTIFNTPNPRLMNVSLLRESKLLHGAERRGSRASVRGPSRQPSIASLRPQSPQSAGKKCILMVIWKFHNSHSHLSFLVTKCK
jgi:hypothetical protein